VPGDNLAVVIDQDRDIKAEGLDALGDLPDLLLAVTPRVSRIPVLGVYGGMNENFVLVAGRDGCQADGV
jgi:hypothetical protein